MIERADVLIIGGGAAALRCAIGLGPRVLLLTKKALPDANTFLAQGGVAAAMDEGDTLESHEHDTVEAGRGLSDPAIVRMVVEDGPARMKELVGWGAKFDRGFALEGGHSHARVLHRGDRTGREVFRTLLERARPGLRAMEDTYALDLLVERGRCRGALAWNRERGVFRIAAGAVVLATGGAGRVFRETTNPDVATGDGVAMAYRAGAEVQDLEFMQFHPTALYLAGAPRALISEAVRGAGAVLRDSDGRAFMKDAHPMADLAPRDETARAILRRMVETGDTQVYLDTTTIPPPGIGKRFPALAELAGRFHVALEAIPVRPAAHYTIGGVRTNEWGDTSLPGLYAVGECAATGFHGANRLGSNSLLECVVMGRRAAVRLLECDPKAPRSAPPPPEPTRRVADRDIDVTDLTQSLRSLMWRHAGLERDAGSLSEAVRRVEQWSAYALRARFDAPEGWELQNMLIVGGLMARAALAREESRGAHFRRDFPKADPAWARHLVWRRSKSLTAAPKPA